MNQELKTLDEETEASPDKELRPAPLFKRMIAFGMDFILIVLLLQLLAHFMPSFWDAHTQEEFQNLKSEGHLRPQLQMINAWFLLHLVFGF